MYEYDILDSMPEKEYDDITKIAAEICGMPISLISIIDNNRQWFKSKYGFEAAESSRDIAFCAHAILNPEEIFIVADPLKDERFFDNPLVLGTPNIAFYAGVPLTDATGHALGTLCVLDNKPNELSKAQKETLKALARQVVANFEVRRMNKQLLAQKAEMEQLNKDLARFAQVTAHDMKSPCASIAMCSNYLKENYSGILDEEGKIFLDMMEKTSLSAIEMVEGILNHTKQVNRGDIEKEIFKFGSLIDELKKLIIIPAGFSFENNNNELELYTSRPILLQVLLNLCNNAIKYNDKEHGSIMISAADTGASYAFSVKDNGPGISPENQNKIFELFFTLGVRDRNNNLGTGIGLSTVKRLVQKMGGDISINSQPGNGCSFDFTISK